MGSQELANTNLENQIEMIRELTALRHERGLTLEDVARHCSTDVEEVLAFERGLHSTAAFLRRYATVVGARLEFSVSSNAAG